MTEEKKTFICLKDAISVVYRTKHMVDLTDSMKSVIVAKDAIVLGLKKLPTIEEPKTGHWGRKTKVDAYDIAGVKTWGIKCQCDRCGFTIIVVEDFGYYKYCPNCGAKMESEDKK